MYNNRLKHFARELRKKMTDAEKLLWSRLRGKQLKGCRFYREKIIGDYIVDFYCIKAKLVIEVDGGQHYSEKGIKKDSKRDEYLRGLGLKILRFSNIDVLRNPEGVIERIYENIPPEGSCARTSIVANTKPDKNTRKLLKSLAPIIVSLALNYKLQKKWPQIEKLKTVVQLIPKGMELDFLREYVPELFEDPNPNE